jgi:sulfur relay (sulfurtransferase) complex TusBCD TusD component (DsrE family)
MSQYLLIESRCPFESADVDRFLDLAAGLVGSGHGVTLFLVQNGVLSTRHGVKSTRLMALVAAGIEVRADEFSLRERGIAPDRLIPGVKAAQLDLVIDRMASGDKTIWN